MTDYATEEATAMAAVEAKFEETQRDLYLTFHLHGEDYGIAITWITEIIGFQSITQVPDMPGYIRGVINLRGRVIPVMDVRLRFGLPECDYDERTCVIVVDVDETTIGLVVDRVKDVVAIPDEQIGAPPMCGGSHGYIQGLGKVGKEVKIILEMQGLLDEEELLPLAEAS